MAHKRNQPRKTRTKFTAAINQICAERGISSESIFATIQDALIAAYRKDHQIKEDFDYQAELNEVTGQAKIFQIDPNNPDNKQDVTPVNFGRIAAQTAKQVILQQVREQERAANVEEYRDKIDTLINGMILHFKGSYIVVDIGKGEGVIPPQEQARNERYDINQRLTFYIKDIEETNQGKQVILSRSDSALIEKLFAREVPEVNSGAVEIKVIAREAGSRSKIAVVSTQSGVDPVGSCVGQKGVRVQAIINELNGEKIDIIQFSEDSAKFIAASLQPADDLDIELDEQQAIANITIPEDQLSLAIGKNGQNVRLAAKLTGYKINLNSDQGETVSANKDEHQYQIDSLNLSSRVRNNLVKAELTDIDSLSEKSDAQLKTIPGIGPKSAQEIKQALADN